MHKDSEMISVPEAISQIKKNTLSLTIGSQSIGSALGSVLAENIISPINLPLFDQSAMDGYAIIYKDFSSMKNIKIIGEVAAGGVFKKKVVLGQAVRIFTGAPVPAGATAVVMQEKTEVDNGFLVISDQYLKRDSNIRKKGSQIKQGQIALKKGSELTAGAIGYLAALGITTVKTICKPRISIIATGSELIKPGKPLKPGQIYESNSFALDAALKSINIKALNITAVSDNETKILNSLKRSIQNADIILITGGISVGDYDFTGISLKNLGVKNIFYKIKQKPGKPLFFGKTGKTLIFGLPGNPAAVLSCFYEYVFPAIQIMQGRKNIFLKKAQLPISKNYSKKSGLSLFLKGKISGECVIPLEGQESFVLSSFAVADCLIYLPEEAGNIKTGELVEVHLLPGM